MRGKRARRGIDPRVLGGMVTLGVLALVVAVGTMLDRTAGEARDSLSYVRHDLEVARQHLVDTLRANEDGETLLQRAAATTGEPRNAAIAQSIAVAEAAAEAWTRYEATALGLEGEAELAAAYARDYVTGKDIAGDILVPIVQSNQPGVIPDEQVVVAARIRADVRALVDLYDRERAVQLRRLDDRVRDARSTLLASMAAAAGVVVVGGTLVLRVARRVVADRQTRAAAAAVAAVEAQLIRALELVDDEDGAFRVAADALSRSMALDSAPVTIVVADLGGTRLVPVVGERPVCGVEKPDRCPALRAGAALQFADSSSLDACPVLASGYESVCSATCVPVSVAGSDAALIQIVGPAGRAPELGELVHLTVRRVGERVTLLRAMAGLEVQASRDPLTGLLNRRSFEAAACHLARDGIPYSVAFADLDHFKLLNDVQGHDAGDRALRGFARTLRDTLRPDDISCRWGGEEFVVALPGCTEAQAVVVMERLRSALARGAGDGPGVTVSCGVAEADLGEPLDEAVSRADAALLQAKAAGRDRVVVWT